MSLIRKNRFEYIKKSLDILDDDTISDIYNKIIAILNKEIKKNNITRADKLLHIETHLRLIDDDNLELITKIIKSSFEESENDKKIKVVIGIINKILIVIDKDPITDLCEFIDIKRDDILSDDVKNIIEENKKDLFKEKGFKKKDCVVQETNITYPHFSILKGIIKDVGYEMKSKNKTKMIDKVKTMITTYSIIKKE
jgi:hypothetical protein